MNDDEILLQKAALGDEAQAFMESAIGQAIIFKAQEARAKGLAELKIVDADDPAKIRHWQNEVWKAEAFMGWLAELIRDGESALQLLESPEE